MSTIEQHDVEVLTPTSTEFVVARVNLLPPEVLEARRFKSTKRNLAIGVAATIVAVGIGYWASVDRVDTAEAQLAAAQTETTRLEAEQARYAEVPQVIAQVDAAKSARSEALATNVAWYRYLNDLALTYPEEVWLGSLNATVPGAAGGDAVAGVTGSNPLATPGVGTVTFTGTGYQHSDVAAWLDVLADTDGFADAYFTESSRTEINNTDVVEFSSEVVLTGDALWDRFESEER